MKHKNWTREETIIAFNVYCKIPFKSSSKTHPLIIEYANIIDRSPSALNMKVGNFGSLDPELKRQGIVGLTNSSKLDREVWEEFNGNWDELAFESEKLIAEIQEKSIDDRDEFDVSDLPKGEERESLVKTRVNQDFFRKTILASYNSTCCVTGLGIPKLLSAGHIMPWSVDHDNRTNPHNGLCLSNLHHKAFDEGYLTITPDFKILISSELLDQSSNDPTLGDFFTKYHKRDMIRPDRFLPSREFLDYHSQDVFKK